MQASTKFSTKTAYVDSQAINYPDLTALSRVTERLKSLPPLCSLEKIQSLKEKLVLAEQNKLFILHAGDCAERFSDVSFNLIQAKVHQLQLLSKQLEEKLSLPIVPIGRIAGQYAKPRSILVEQKNGQQLPSYRGDLINDALFTYRARLPNPERLLMGYTKAKFSLQSIEKSLSALKNPLDFFVSHEALNLPYEKSLSKNISPGTLINHSTHLPWLGMRTAHKDSPHLAYLSTLVNPIAVKLGPNTTPRLLMHLVEHLNPNNEAGRLVLIPRIGLKSLTKVLPELIHCTQKENYRLSWLCDPMHGNTVTFASGIKTRFFNEILEEINLSFAIHRQLGSHLSGLHLELTPEAVFECLEENTSTNESQAQTLTATSALDPRLNHTQTLKLISKIQP